MASYKKKNNIGEGLNKALTLKGITVTKFADEIGLSRSLVQKYLTNTKHPTDDTVQRIADYFELPVEFFTSDDFFSDENPSSVRDKLINAINEKLDEHRSRQVFNASLKLAEDKFNNSSRDEKSDIAHKAVHFSTGLNEKESIINLMTDTRALHDIQGIFKKYYTDLSLDQIVDRIKRIDASEGISVPTEAYPIYLQSLENNIVISLSDQEYKRYLLMNDLERIFNENRFDNISRFVLVSIEYYLEDLKDKKYDSACNQINGLIEALKKDSNSRTVQNVSGYLKRYSDRLMLIEISLFELSILPILQLGEGKIDQAINHLEILRASIVQKLQLYSSQYNSLNTK